MLIYKDMITLVALCAIGTEKILSNEIKQLGYSPCKTSIGRVSFTASNEEALFRTNLCLRTADRVFLQMSVFKAYNFDDLFDGVKAIDWQDYFNKDTRIVIDKVRSNSKNRLSSEHSIQGIVHKAIYSKLGEVWHMFSLPETGATSTVRVYIEDDEVLILLDLSGEPLHKRGYRTAGGEAPLRETVAASLLQMMMWRRKTPLHDPFCGSGTILIEAALYAYNIAPGFGRHFALENLKIFDSQKALEIKKKEAALIRPDCVAHITGTDIDPEALDFARLNAEHACVMAGRALQLIGSDQRIQRPDFDQADFKEIEAPYESGCIISNPPYGERLGEKADAERLYGEMKELFNAFPGWQLGFITSHERFESIVGKKSQNKKKIKCGNLDTYFYMFKDSPKN